MVLANALVGSRLALVIAILCLASPFVLASDPALAATDPDHPIAAGATVDQTRKEEKRPLPISLRLALGTKLLLHLAKHVGRDYSGMAAGNPDSKTSVCPEVSPIAQYIADSHYAPPAAPSGGNPPLIQIASDEAKAHILLEV
jgi:hypothetical protein